MKGKFTRLFFTFLLTGIFAISFTNLNAQNCDIPTNVSTSNISNFSADLNWDADTNVDHYRVRYREVGSPTWLFDHNVPAGVIYNLSGLNSLLTYEWQAKAVCSAGTSPSSSWSLVQAFTTTNYPVDCNNTPNGTAYIDSCGNCVEGTTGNLPCIDFTPTVSMTLSSNECNTNTDFNFSFSQDPNEPDVASAVFSSDGGSFDFTGLSPNDTVGSSVNSAAGGQISVTTTLMVDFIISNDKISVKSVDDISGQVYSSFTIENIVTGILIVSTSLPDNNNVTQGNSQNINLSGLFANPSPSTITFTSTINSELGDVDVQTTTEIIDCTDCNGDFGGAAYTDSCGNCVGGNTGDLPCIPFSPTVSVSLSNTNCDSLSDLTISVSQDPNEPDMSTSLFSSDGGSFTISSMNVGDTVGSATMQAGNFNFNTILIVSSIISSNQAIIQSINIATGLSLGTFTISNVAGGISILAQSVPDNNNVTSGNSQTVIFNNIFINPGAGSLIFTSTINSELSDTDVQNFPFNISCLCVPNSSTDVQVACDSFTWIDGVTYTSSNNTSSVTLTNVGGCDSIVTLNLTINYSATSSDTVTANNSYTWNGTTYTTSGTYTFLTTTINGCDSTVTLILTINTCSVPTNTTTTNILLDRATMNWSVVAGSHHYEIRFKQVGTSTWQIITEYGTFRTKTGLSSSTDYHWQVRTSCDATSTFTSAWSDTTTFQTMSPCSTPTNPNESVIGLDFATLTWDADPNAYSYRVRHRKSSSTWIIDTVFTSSITLNSLDHSSTYNWRVQSICDSAGNNNSSWTPILSFNTLTPCGNPSSLTVDSVGVNEAYLSWTSPLGTDHTVVRYSLLGSGIWNSATTTTSNISLTGLATYDDHIWEIISFCDASGLNNSDTISGPNFSTANPCEVPQNLHTTNILLDRMTFNWSSTTLADHYEVRWRQQGNATWNVINNIYDTSRIKAGLLPGTTYEWAVRSICDASGTSFSAWSATQTQFTQTPCPIPMNLVASNSTLTSIQLDWDVVPGAVAYRVKYRLSSSSWIIDTIYTNSLSLTGLNSGSTYNWRVQSMCDINGGNNSPWTAIHNFNTITPCSVPYNMSVTQIGLTSAKFIMYGPNNPDHYYVLYKDVNTSVWDTLTITSSDISGIYASKTVTGLNNSTTYEWKSQSSCSADDSNLSPFATGTNFTTLTPCALPTNNAAFVNGQNVIFTWDVVTGAVSYTAKYRKLGNTQWQTVTVTNPTYTANNLGYGLSYEWAVSSNCDYNGTNSSPYSSLDTFTTSSCPNASNISFTNITTTSVKMIWTSNNSVHHYAIRGRVVGTTPWTKNLPIVYGNNRTINGLLTGETYEFQMRSACTNDTSNVSAWSALQSFSTLVDCSTQPTALTESNITLTSADLSFTGTTNAVAYLVRFRLTSGGIWIYDTLTAPTVGLSKTGLTANTNYSWQVKAVCDISGISASAWAPQQVFSTLVPCPDPSNLNVYGNQTTISSFKVSWNGLGGTYSYEVLIKESTSATWDTLIVTTSSVTTTGINATSTVTGNGSFVTLVFTGLTAGTTYEWKVMAQCSAGGINNSSFVSGNNVTTVEPCSTPTSLSTTAVSATNATANWAATATAHHYAIRGRVQGNSSWSINIDNHYSTSRTFSGLTAGETYEWQVRSVCSSDTSEVSAWSASEVFSTLVSCDNAPSNLETENITLTTATLEWDVHPNAQAYQLRVKESSQGGSGWIYSVLPSSVSHLDKTGLSPQTSYDWQIRTICDTVNSVISPWSAWQSFNTDQPCQLPSGLIIRNNQTTLTSAAVRWYGPGGTDFLVMFKELSASNWDTLLVSGNSIVTNITQLPVGVSASYSAAGSQKDLSITGLSQSTTYVWNVISRCSSYNMSSAVSGPNFTTLTACQVPSGFSVTIAMSSANVSWTAVIGAVKYDIRKREQGGSWGSIIIEYSTSRNFSGLSAATTYEWEIRSHCDYSGTNMSAWSSTQSFTTQAACQIPTNATALNITANSADLVWDDMSAYSYKIKWRQVGGGLTVTTITPNILSLTGLNANKTHKWKVKSNCDANLLNVSAFTSWQYFNTLSSIRISAGDQAIANNLNIYPNPTRGMFNISFVSDEVVSLNMSISDAYGKQILVETEEMFVGEYTKQVDLSAYPKGIYMVQIKTNDSFITKRVVVQ